MEKVLLLLMGLFLTQTALGQITQSQLLSTAGNTYVNANIQLDWSIGECITQTYNSGSYMMTQGFQQGNFNVSGIEDLRTDLDIVVFPNPTQKTIIIKWKDYDTYAQCQNQVEIIDISGKIMLSKKLFSSELALDLSGFIPGVYILSIRQDNQLTKSFKIIKN